MFFCYFLSLTLNYLQHLFGSEMLHVSIKVLKFFFNSIPKDRRGPYVRRYKHKKKSCSKDTKTIYLSMVTVSSSKALGMPFLFCLHKSELKNHKVFCNSAGSALRVLVYVYMNL